MGLLTGKKGLILGVLNDRSIAWGIAANLAKEGATLGFTHLPGEKFERRCRSTVEQLSPKPGLILPCDVSKDEDIQTVMARWKEIHGTLDILVHSIAFAPAAALHEPFLQTKREDWKTALDISAYSLVALCREAAPLFNPGGSVIALSYLGSIAYIPKYNVMAVAKAALECSVRYLAAELGGGNREGAKKVRVNAISAGPIPTMAAKGVGDIDIMLDHYPQKNCLGRNVDQDEVGRTAIYLASDLSSGVTGEVIYVDGGYRIVGW